MKTILVVDDEESLLNVFGRMLKRLNYNVLLAASGEEAIRLFKDNNPEIVFLDFMLKDTNGLELLKQMKDINSKANICFVSGCDKEYLEKHNITPQHKADGYLIKPITVEIVKSVLDSLAANNKMVKIMETEINGNEYPNIYKHALVDHGKVESWVKYLAAYFPGKDLYDIFDRLERYLED